MSVAVGIQVNETASRTWLITDVDRGVGGAVSEQLLAFGERVVGTVRDLDAADHLIERHPGMFDAEQLDPSNTANIRDVVDRSFERLGGVDVILSTIESIKLIHAVLPRLRTQGSGRILQQASPTDHGGTHGFIEAVTEDVAPFRIDLTLFEPGSGDLFLLAEALIDSADQNPAPARLILG